MLVVTPKVYLLLCPCTSFYIGKTRREFRRKMYEHRYYASIGFFKSPIGRHFVFDLGYKLDHLMFVPLCHIPTPPTSQVAISTSYYYALRHTGHIKSGLVLYQGLIKPKPFLWATFAYIPLCASFLYLHLFQPLSLHSFLLLYGSIYGPYSHILYITVYFVQYLCYLYQAGGKCSPLCCASGFGSLSTPYCSAGGRVTHHVWVP